jgi:hypothetical protein
VNKSIARLIVVAATAGLGAAEQPLEFPHMTHVAAGLECLDCHTGVESRAAAGIPSVRKCMLCHARIAVDRPGVEALRRFAAEGREIPWVRVYRFPASAQVKFVHSAHTRARIECRVCHGPVEQMTVAQPVARHTMGSCITCHRQRGASTDCTACHY